MASWDFIDMAHVTEGNYSGEALKIGIVVSRFNEFITKAMLDSALNELRRLNVSDTQIHVVWVPGAFELPFGCQTLLQSKNLDALIVIGCIIRGETSHYEHLAQSVFDGIQKVALEQSIPIGFGVLTVENMAQAIERAGGKHGNKGRDAARSAVEMAHLIHTLTEGGERETALKNLIERELNR